MSENLTSSQSDKQNKFFPFLLILGLAAFVYLGYTLHQQLDFAGQISMVREMLTAPQEESASGSNETNSDLVDSYVLVAQEDGQTPFSLLQEKTEVEYTQYDFGVFVTAINNQPANEEFYWALYVNQEYAQVASDQLELKAGDQVEWRYEAIES